MCILYIASQTDESETLNLEREITDVQRQLSQTSLRDADIEFLPDITIEVLPIEFSRIKPDLLHISVHGERECSGSLKRPSEASPSISRGWRRSDCMRFSIV